MRDNQVWPPHVLAYSERGSVVSFKMRDTYKASWNTVLQTIIEKAPAGAERRLLGLKKALTEGFEPQTHVCLEFERSGTSCNLEVSWDADYSSSFHDSEGNQWLTYTIKVSLGWPSHGAQDIYKAQERLAFMTEIATFGEVLRNCVPRIVDGVIFTKAQLEENHKAYVKSQVSIAVDLNSTRMAVGNTRVITVIPPRSFKQGECDAQVVTLHKRKRMLFNASVTGDNQVTFTRTA